jgi:hypothetical protein
MFNFIIREARCSGGLFHIEARSDGKNGKHRRWFNITAGTYITTARQKMKDKGALTKLAEQVYNDRYG